MLVTVVLRQTCGADDPQVGSRNLHAVRVTYDVLRRDIYATQNVQQPAQSLKRRLRASVSERESAP